MKTAVSERPYHKIAKEFVGGGGYQEAISAASLPELDAPEVASVYGGHVQAHKIQDDRLQPDRATYRVTLEPTTIKNEPAQRSTGTISIQSRPLSTLVRIYRKTIALFMGEAGF